MIVVAIIALLAAIAVPGFLRARKRAQATAIRNDLRQIDSAIDQYALENGRGEYSIITIAAWKGYMQTNSRLYSTGTDIFGNKYTDQHLGTLPPVASTAWDSLNDVADASFWAPYVRGQ